MYIVEIYNFSKSCTQDTSVSETYFLELSLCVYHEIQVAYIEMQTFSYSMICVLRIIRMFFI